MKPKKILPALCAAALLCGLSLPVQAQEQQKVQSLTTLTAAGSGVNLGITKILANAFMANYPGVEVVVPGSIGTKGAITAVKDNAITIGLISRALKESEQSPDYTVVAYARTPIVVGANSSVTDEGVSYDDLVAIYKGTKAQWADGKPIVVQTREAFDSGFMVLEKAVPGFKEACEESRKAERWATFFTDQDANQALSKTRNAIGVTDLGMIATEKLDVKVLKLNGVMPSVETLQNGQYPLDRTLYLLYREKTAPVQAKAFVDFIFSPVGVEILKANGYVPMERKAP